MSEATADPGHVAARLRAAGCVFAEDEARLLLEEAGTVSELDEMVRRRGAGEPIEHVLGWAELAGVRVLLDRGVFVPRARTQVLVAVALDVLARVGATRPGDRPAAVGAQAGRARVVVDLCCGSGAIGLVLARAVPALDLYAADLDPTAVACARRNLAGLGTVLEGDLYAALPSELRGRVDLLAANVPYVPSTQVRLLPGEARDHEPMLALDGGPDGLEVLRRVLGPARTWLAPGGVLVSELSAGQASAARMACVRAGLVAYTVHSEDPEATVLVATRPVDLQPDHPLDLTTGADDPAGPPAAGRWPRRS